VEEKSATTRWFRCVTGHQRLRKEAEITKGPRGEKRKEENWVVCRGPPRKPGKKVPNNVFAEQDRNWIGGQL